MKLHTAILAWLLVGGIGTLAAILAVLNLVRGEYLTAFAALGACAFCYGLVVPLPKVVRGTVTPRGEVDDEGTTFWPDRGIDVPVQVSWTGIVVASALITVLVPAGRLAVSVPPFMRYSLPFVCAAIAVTGAPMVWRNFRRGGIKYLRLTPGGFAMEEGWRSTSGQWEQVRDIADEAPGQQAPTRGAVVFVMADDSAPTIAAGAITPDGTALRELVRFYWKHPESRGELTDGRAPKRLADERFDAPS